MESLLNKLYTAQQIINEAYGRFNAEHAVSSQAIRTRDAGLKKLKDCRLLIIPIAIAMFFVSSIFFDIIVGIGHLEENFSLIQALSVIVVFGVAAGASRSIFCWCAPF